MVGSNHSSGPSRPHVILFVDNVPAFLETRAEYLEDAGYQVVPAYTLEEARRLLEQQTIDLAILDVRMVDDEDPKDISGILLARDPHYASVPKIILTDYPDYRTARQALGPVLDGMPPAVDYLDKKEGPEVMVERVGQVLAQFNPLNQHLMIRWASEWSFPALVTLLEPHVGTALEGRASELERLFRRLFLRARQLTFGRSFLREPGHLYLEVTRLDQDGNVHVEVLRCGRRSLGEQETDRYGCFAPAEAVLGTTLLDEDRVSIHYSVARYRLVGSFGPPIRPLGEVIQSLPLRAIGPRIDKLYQTTLGHWHQRGRRQSSLSPLSYFLGDGLRVDELRGRLREFCLALERFGLARITQEPGQWSIRYPAGFRDWLPDPLAAWEGGMVASLADMPQGHIHGAVTLDRILVDRDGQSWLIDFRAARQDFLIQDYLSLEMDLRRRLLEPLDLDRRLEFEEELMAHYLADDPEGRWPGRDAERPEEVGLPPWIRAWVAVRQVRRAANLYLQVGEDQYGPILYAYCLHQLSLYDPAVQHTREELLHVAQHLLLASLLSQSLMPAPDERADLPEEAFTGIWIDSSNREVWVAGRPVSLTPQEYTLLDFLYQRKGQLCTPEAITQALEGEDYDFDKAVDEHRVRSAINRLRRKIEPLPGQPRFLKTVRGHGYRLDE